MNVRLKIVFALFLVIAFGLASRKYTWLFPNVLDEYPGDALWAVAAYVGWALLFPFSSPWKLMMLAIATSFFVEFSQMYHATWLDELRSNSIGHLFLGSAFNAIDLIAYLVGVLFAFTVDSLLIKRGLFRAHST